MTIKKTLHELAKEFPNKTYRELEKYRNADRQEEAQRIFTQQENEERTESQQKQEELEPIEGINWEELYEKEHKLRQEAEGELTILKGIETNRVKEAQARSSYVQDELDRVKRENNDLHNKVAALLDAVDPEKKIQKARESGL
jgi:hypothetical protein